MTHTFTATPDSLSVNPVIAAAQLDILYDRAEKALVEAHKIKASRFEMKVAPFDRLSAYLESLGADEVTAREMAADALDAAEDVSTSRLLAREVAIVTHQDGDGKLNGVDGTAYQQDERTRSDLLGLNQEARS